MGDAKISSPDFNVMGSASLGIIQGKIMYIELLEGETMKTDPEVIQYVNIQQNKQVHLNSDVTHTDRFGRYLRCKVKFNKEGIFRFKVKVIPHRRNAWYTAEEKGRSDTFKCSDKDIDFTTDENGEKIIELGQLYVAPAGGDIYTIAAKDAYGNEVKASSKIKNERLLYYLELKMKKLKNIPKQLDILKGEYARHNIKLQGLKPVKMPYIGNIDYYDVEPFIKIAQKKYSQSKDKVKDPYSIALVYVDQLASQGEGVLKYQDAERSDGHITLRTYDFQKGRHTYLWKDLDKRKWFVECYYIENDTETRTRIRIPKKKCKVSRTAKDVSGGGLYNTIDIDVSRLPKGKKCEVTLIVKWVDSFCGGFSIHDINIIAIATRCMWSVLASEEKLQEIAIHEIGHQIGMVPNGSNDNTNKSKLDKTPFFYDHTHVGDHCAKPNICVMYGALRNVHSFCPFCAKTVRKIDLGNGVVGM